MRIIGGEWKGRRLVTPPITERRIRPTSDRARESIFNVLYHNGLDFVGSTGLDLYAGTGALGLEALSRGAKQALWVDRFDLSIDLIKQNIEKMGCKKEVPGRIFQSEILPFLDDVRLQEFLPLRWIFVDPPYADLESHRVIERIAERALEKSNVENPAETRAFWNPEPLW